MISTMYKLVLEILGKIEIYKSCTKVCPETPVFTLATPVIDFIGRTEIGKGDHFWLPKSVRGNRFWRGTEIFVTRRAYV